MLILSFFLHLFISKILQQHDKDGDYQNSKGLFASFVEQFNLHNVNKFQKG